MKCPYCEEEFVEGYLATGSQRIAWLTEEPYAHAYPQREGDFFVTKSSFLQVSHVKSLYCNKCRIILTKGLLKRRQLLPFLLSVLTVTLDFYLLPSPS